MWAGGGVEVAQGQPRLSEQGLAVAPGGMLLVVGHHPDDLSTGLRHVRRNFMFTLQDLVPALDPETWEVEVVDVRTRTMAGRDGKPATVSDSVLGARRRG